MISTLIKRIKEFLKTKYKLNTKKQRINKIIIKIK